MKSNDYRQRNGVENITWERFALFTRTLVEQLAAENVDVVIGIARGGLMPATFIASALRCEMFPIRLTRRMNDVIVHSSPACLLDVAIQVANRKCAVVVDDVVDTGQTLAMAAQLVRRRGVPKIISACVAARSWANPQPDYAGIQTDALVIFPWDRHVYVDGAWQMHPETAEALRLQEKYSSK
jgi:uncharacterized protein